MSNMKRILAAGLVLLLGLVAIRCRSGESHPPTGAARLAIVGANVMPMTSDTILYSHTVLIEGGRIVQIGPEDSVRVPDDAEVVRGAGRFLTPGLVDVHVHLRAESELNSYLRHGVTTVAALRGTETVLTIREKVRSGTLAGPRILTAGPLIDGEPPIWPGAGTRVVTTREQARAAADEHCRSDFDLVKVYNNLRPDLLEELVNGAHECGLPVVAHLPRLPVRREGLTRALAAGIDVIAHGEEVFFTHLGGGSNPEIDQGTRPVADGDIASAVAVISAAGTYVIPNLSFIAMTARMLEDAGSVFGDEAFARLAPEVQELWRSQNPARRPDVDAFARRERVKRSAVARFTALLQAAHVPLLLGTDASAPGLFPGRSAHLELEELVKAGLTPYEALSTGTRTAARFLDRLRRSRAGRDPAASPPGIIAPGHVADLILVRENPLEDVRHLRAIEGVVVAGRWMPVEGRAKAGWVSGTKLELVSFWTEGRNDLDVR